MRILIYITYGWIALSEFYLNLFVMSSQILIDYRNPKFIFLHKNLFFLYHSFSFVIICSSLSVKHNSYLLQRKRILLDDKRTMDLLHIRFRFKKV